MHIDLSVVGDAAVLANFMSESERITSGFRQLMEETAQYGLERIRSYTPVDTGYLLSRNMATVTEDVVTFSNDASYALFVEIGTYKMAAQPYMVPGWEDAQAYLENNAGKIFG